MAKIELEYIEIDRLLYPNIKAGMENIESDLGKYGILQLQYLHKHKQELYRTLLLTGKLAQALQSEQIQAAWLDTHPMSLEDTPKRIWLRAQAQMIAAEIVTTAFIYKNYLIPLEESILYVVAGLMVMNFSLLASFP